jgi:outer membrane protein OmpA-like peptidoglycan-associated protein
MRMREPEIRLPRRTAAIRRYQVWTAAVAAVVVLAGCGSSHHKSATSTSAKTTTTTHRAATTDKPIATVRDVAVGAGGPEYMRLSIYDLRRAGPYVVLDFGITCLISGSGCDQELDFAAPSHSGEQVYANANTASGVRLIDPAAHKEYLPVRDSQNRPFASQLPLLDDSLTHLAWVVFPAPPASVSSVDVTFPVGGPQVPSIPISASGSPPAAAAGITAARPAPFATSLGSTDTTGLTLPIENLVSTVGNPNGSDSESGTQDTITLHSDVLFRFDKSNLTPGARAIISHVAPQIKARAIGPVKVTGYTDSIGTDAVNIPLSIARAHSVMTALQPLTPGVNYLSAGMGSADPVAPNTKPDGSDDPAGRALNRRVTIVFAVKAPTPPAPPAAAATTAAAPAAQSGTMTFTVNGSGSSDGYQVGVDALFREDDLLVLKVNLLCASSTGQLGGSTCDGETDLAGTDTVPPVAVNTSSAEYNTISGFYLSDPITGTEYIPLQDTDGVPLTAGVTSNLRVHGRYPLWLYFPAPPSSVTNLTVVAPGGSTSVPHVAISPSAPAP